MLGYDSDNHTEFMESVTKQATYTEDGEKRFTCLGCGYEYTEVIPKLECAHETTVVYRDESAGKTYKKCSTCGELIEEIPEDLQATCRHTAYSRQEVTITPADSTPLSTDLIVITASPIPKCVNSQ